MLNVECFRLSDGDDCSEGTFENSPAFQCRVRVAGNRVPKGRLKNQTARPFRRPFGTRAWVAAIPALKRRAIFTMSLRDDGPAPAARCGLEFPTAVRKAARS